MNIVIENGNLKTDKSAKRKKKKAIAINIYVYIFFNNVRFTDYNWD